MPLPAEHRRQLRRLELVAQRRLAGLLAGEYRSRFRGQGLELAEIRPYQPGDEVRRLAWNVTARTGAPHVRIDQEERSRTLLLLADVSPSCTPPLRQLQLECLALLGYAAAASRDRVGLIAFSDRVELLLAPAAGHRAVQRLLHALLSLQPVGHGTDLAVPLAALEQLVKRPALMVLVSDAQAPLPERLLRKAAARHELLALLLRDAAELIPPTVPLLRVRDAESGALRLLDLATAARRQALQRAWQSHDHRLCARLRGFGVDPLLLRSDRPPLPELIRLFRRRRP